MNAKNLVLSLLAAAVIAAAPAISLASDAEQPRPCPQRMIGCEHGTPHKECVKAAPAAEKRVCPAKELSEEQKAEIAKKRAEFKQKRAEQKAHIAKLTKEHHAAIAPLREQLMQKRMELDVLSPNPNVKPEELKALVAEIVSLRKQIRTLQHDFRAEMRKAGVPCKPLRGHHHEGLRGDCGPRHAGHGWDGHGPRDSRCPAFSRGCELPR